MVDGLRKYVSGKRRKVGGHGNEVWHDKHTYIRIIILDINFVLWLFFFYFSLSLPPISTW